MTERGAGPSLDGETRLIAIIGDPIAQVKSPAGVTRALQEAGRNCIVIPIHATPADLDTFIHGVSVAKNIDGLIATVPHKFAMLAHCASLSDSARFLGAVNALRRNPDRSWHGDMLDGLGFVEAARRAGCDPRGRRTLLAGAGGAGSAIALELLNAGVTELAIHDQDATRREALRERLATKHPGKVSVGSADPSGYTFIVNATPMGMRSGDLEPVRFDRLRPDMFVGDVITVPEISPLLAAARCVGCITQTGVGMFNEVAKLIVRFYTEAAPVR